MFIFHVNHRQISHSFEFSHLAVEIDTTKPPTITEETNKAPAVDPKKLKKEISVESNASTNSSDGDKKQVCLPQ